MTDHPTHITSPDALHGWVWGCTAGTLAGLGLEFSWMVGLAGALAGVIVLLPGSIHRRRVLVAGALGALTMRGVVPLLAGLTPWPADSALAATLIIGACTGVAAELLRPGTLMPGVRDFRILFLEMCVLTGLLGGFLLLPKLKFIGSSDLAGRLTFGAALVLLFVMIPAALTSAATRFIRRLRSA